MHNRLWNARDDIQNGGGGGGVSLLLAPRHVPTRKERRGLRGQYGLAENTEHLLQRVGVGGGGQVARAERNLQRGGLLARAGGPAASDLLLHLLLHLLSRGLARGQSTGLVEPCRPLRLALAHNRCNLGPLVPALRLGVRKPTLDALLAALLATGTFLLSALLRLWLGGPGGGSRLLLFRLLPGVFDQLVCNGGGRDGLVGCDEVW